MVAGVVGPTRLTNGRTKYLFRLPLVSRFIPSILAVRCVRFQRAYLDIWLDDLGNVTEEF